jgi:hypothetical protein
MILQLRILKKKKQIFFIVSLVESQKKETKNKCMNILSVDRQLFDLYQDFVDDYFNKNHLVVLN